MRISLVFRIAAAFSVALASLVALAASAYFNLAEQNASTLRVTRAYDVLDAKEKVQRLLADIQGAGRGYVIAAEGRFRSDILGYVSELTPQLERLRKLTAEDAYQSERIRRLDDLVERRLAAIDRLMQARDANVTDDVDRAFNEGSALSASVRQLARETDAHQRGLLDQYRREAGAARGRTSDVLLYGSALAFVLSFALGTWLISSTRKPLKALSVGADRLAHGDYAYRVQHFANDEIGALAAAFNDMAAQVERRQAALAQEAWIKDALSRLSRMLEGKRDLASLAQGTLGQLAELLDVQYGAFYVPVEDGAEPRLLLQGAYAVTNAPATIGASEGLLGQAFTEGKRLCVHDLPDDYVRIASSIGAAPARHLLVLPAVLNAQVRGVIELASFAPFSEVQLQFLDQFADGLALVLNTVIANMRTEDLLKQAQQLSATLDQQRAELAERNDELEEQSNRLRASEELLQQQQEELKQANEELEQTNEELQQTNEEMEEREQMLHEQKRMLEQTNLEIEAAKVALEEKSRQLTLTSRYKSEFLANMSHELRTPLNSLLILSKLLADNTEGTLTGKQVQHARTIWSSGNDLLRLIDDVLDLSKVEAGALDLEAEEFTVDVLVQSLRELFEPIAGSRGLNFEIQVEAATPRSLSSDLRRLQQILKNLLANAFKFTTQGSVRLTIGPAASGWPSQSTLSQADQVIAFAVRDSGIGIPADRQQLIFEAFQQAEAGTARKYGGTGLGLSISKELAALLGGAIGLQSTPGAGSTFTLYLPARMAVPSQAAIEPAPPVVRSARPMPTPREEGALQPDLIADDRGNLAEGDPVLLIIEDDRHFAYVLADIARARNFKVVVAGTAGAGIALARSIKPTAITLDLQLPDSDGRVVLDLLKHDAGTRHIPIHVISVEPQREHTLRQGAVSVLEKPVSREALEEAFGLAANFSPSRTRRLLVVEDDPVQQNAIREIIGNGDVETTVVGTAAAALEHLQRTRFDCLVLDLGLPDQAGIDLIRQIHARHGLQSPPVIVYTAKELTRREETELRALSEAIIIKDVRSPERLLDETALFLHRVQARLPEATRRMLERVQREDSVLSGRKVLVVDDDVRNIFAITTALENYRMVVAYAESGSEALEKLGQEDNFSAVLMDVMMPEMDGYEATQRIRAMPQYARLPIIMVTAKAMRGDREKCLQAGASDYITKPVDMDQLRSLLRVWLYR